MNNIKMCYCVLHSFAALYILISHVYYRSGPYYVSRILFSVALQSKSGLGRLVIEVSGP